MTELEISEYLNNAEQNVVADLFLACCGFNRTATDYRLIRNAVLLFPHCTNEWELYGMLESITEITADDLAARIASALTAVEKPIYISFNDRFACSDYNFGEVRKNIEMPALQTPSDILSFLGAVLAYIIKTNYSI